MLSLAMDVHKLQNLQLVTLTEAFNPDFGFRRYCLIELKHQWMCKFYILVYKFTNQTHIHLHSLFYKQE